MDFTRGKLYVKLINDVMVSLFVPLESKPANFNFMLCRTLASGSDTSFGASVGFVTEMDNDGEKTRMGVLTYRAATDEDLKFIVAKWLGEISLERWLEVLAIQVGIFKEEKTRISNIAKELGKIPTI